MEDKMQPNQMPDTGMTPENAPPAAGPEKRKMPVWLIAAITAAVAAVIGGGIWMYMAAREDTQTTVKPSVKVGVLLPLSGGASVSGFGELKGVELAKKQLGADNIELVQADSQCDAEVAKTAIQDLFDQGVVAIIGDACSSASAGVLPLVNQNKVPLISPSASSAALSIPNDYFFRVVPPDEFQGAFTAKRLYDEGYRSVSVLHTDEEYGNGLAEVFVEEFKSLGGNVVSNGSFASGDIALEAQADETKAANPDAIYLISNTAPSAIAAIKLVREAGVTAPIYGADAINDSSILSEVGTAGEGLVVATFSNGTKAFKQTLSNEYPSEEFLYAAAEAYDAFTAIYRAVENGATTGEGVKMELMKLDFVGVSGRIKFNENGEVTDKEHAYDILRAQDGVFVPVEE
jgi:branched-chain amino acid transport system substrate-binding protein